MAQYGFYFDSTRCTGCKTCELACKDYKDLEPGTALRRVYDYEGGSWLDNGDGTWMQGSFVYHLSLACNHCGAPACVQACPMRALDFGPAEDIGSRPGCVDAIAPMPAHHHTVPNVVIRPCAAARMPGDTDGHVANVREVKPERA